MSDFTVLKIDAFRKIDDEWCCPLASTMTDLTTGIALIFFAASKSNMNFLNLVQSARNELTTPPPLFVLTASDQSSTPLLTQMSLSSQSLPQLFITDITGIIRPTSIYNGHRAKLSLANYLKDQQAVAIDKFSSVQRNVLGSSVEQAQAESAV